LSINSIIVNVDIIGGLYVNGKTQNTKKLKTLLTVSFQTCLQVSKSLKIPETLCIFRSF